MAREVFAPSGDHANHVLQADTEVVGVQSRLEGDDHALAQLRASTGDQPRLLVIGAADAVPRVVGIVEPFPDGGVDVAGYRAGTYRLHRSFERRRDPLARGAYFLARLA